MSLSPHSHSHDHGRTLSSGGHDHLHAHEHGRTLSCGGHDHLHAEDSGGGIVLGQGAGGGGGRNNKSKSMTTSSNNEDELDRQNAMFRLKIAACLCISFFLVEVVGGLLAGSLAVLSDAAHLFSDLASFLVAILANHLASLPSTSYHTFGLKRSESLAALFSMISLAVVCVWLGVEAVKRLYYILFVPDVAALVYAVDGRLMSGIACIGVLVNLVLAWVLGVEGHVHLPGADHGHSHDHHDHGCSSSSHGHRDHDHDHHSKNGATTTPSSSSDHHAHSHDHEGADVDVEASVTQQAPDERSRLLEKNPSTTTSPACDAAHTSHSHSHSHAIEHINEVPPPYVSQKEKKRNVNLHAAYLHVLGDLAQSVAVLIAGIVIWFRPGWIIVDPLCTLGFCILVFYSTLSVVRASVAVLLEEVPPQISWQKIHADLNAVPHLRDVHDLHIWCISDGVPSLSLHASCDDGQCEAALKQITAVCMKYGIEHITAQVQPSEGDCITCEHVVNNPCFESMH